MELLSRLFLFFVGLSVARAVVSPKGPSFLAASVDAASRQLLQTLTPAAEPPPLPTPSVAIPPSAEPFVGDVQTGPVFVEDVVSDGVFARLPPANTLDTILLEEPLERRELEPQKLAGFIPDKPKLYFGEIDPELSCNCTDEVPGDVFSCQELRFDGRCDERRIVRAGFCEISCDRCDCCPSLLEMASRRGLDLFRLAVEHLAAIEGPRSVATPLRDPSYQGTLFIPTNDAFGRMLTLLNITQDIFFRQPVLLNQVVTYHVLMGTALATAEELRTGVLGNSLITHNVASFLAVNPNAASVQLQGVGSRSEIMIPDLYACKSLIHVVNEVLLPFPTGSFWE